MRKLPLFILTLVLTIASVVPAKACSPETFRLAQVRYGPSVQVRVDRYGAETFCDGFGNPVARVDNFNGIEALTELNGFYGSRGFATIYGGPLNPDIEIIDARFFHERFFHEHGGFYGHGHGPHVDVHFRR